METKSSRWRESEWWLTIGTILLGILVKLGVISASNSQIASDIMNDIVSLILVVAPVLGWQFTRARKKIAEREQDTKIAEARIIGTAKVEAAIKSADCVDGPINNLDPPKMS